MLEKHSGSKTVVHARNDTILRTNPEHVTDSFLVEQPLHTSYGTSSVVVGENSADFPSFHHLDSTGASMRARGDSIWGRSNYRNGAAQYSPLQWENLEKTTLRDGTRILVAK